MNPQPTHHHRVIAVLLAISAVLFAGIVVVSFLLVDGNFTLTADIFAFLLTIPLLACVVPACVLAHRAGPPKLFSVALAMAVFEILAIALLLFGLRDRWLSP